MTNLVEEDEEGELEVVVCLVSLLVTWGGYKNNQSGFDRGLYYTLGDCGWSCDMMMMSSNDWGGIWRRLQSSNLLLQIMPSRQREAGGA